MPFAVRTVPGWAMAASKSFPASQPNMKAPSRESFGSNRWPAAKASSCPGVTSWPAKALRADAAL